MTDRTGAHSGPQQFNELERAWIGAHLPELRASIRDQRYMKGSLVAALALGLAAHVAGYVLRPAAGTEPFGLLAELLYAFGLALWTGVVVTVFVQVYPEWKRRQIAAAIDEWEQAARERSRAAARARPRVDL